MHLIHRFTIDKDHLVVTDVSDDDSGTYMCVANTTLDNVSASAVLIVVGKNWDPHSTTGCPVLGRKEKESVFPSQIVSLLVRVLQLYR